MNQSLFLYLLASFIRESVAMRTLFLSEHMATRIPAKVWYVLNTTRCQAYMAVC